MSDIAHIFDETLIAGDYLLIDGGLKIDDGLRTAVIQSMFTDARARPDDVLPDGAESRRGWWGDALPPAPDGETMEGDRYGSRLWLLGREKIVGDALARAKEYTEECLQWMLDRGVANRIDVETGVENGDWLAIGVRIHEPDGNIVDFRFAYAWTAEETA